MMSPAVMVRGVRTDGTYAAMAAATVPRLHPGPHGPKLRQGRTTSNRRRPIQAAGDDGTTWQGVAGAPLSQTAKTPPRARYLVGAEGRSPA
jgi:hypothetical protein